MTFVWKHPKYYEELKQKLKEQQVSENDRELDNTQDKELTYSSEQDSQKD
jgi:hypothetical protein